MENKELNIEKFENAAARLRALAHPLRIAMIELLQKNERLTVTEIYQHLNIEQAAASHHLNILKNKGILITKRSGTHVLYSLKNQAIIDILQCVDRCQN